MASSSQTEPIGNTASQPGRKKTPGACERCREKRVKCNGTQPCSQCVAKGVDCVFTFNATIGGDVFSEKLDLILTKIGQIEQTLDHHNQALNSLSKQGSAALISSNLDTEQSIAASHRLPVREPTRKGIVQLNRQTGCFEYYGVTSAFVAASSLGKRIRQLEEDSNDTLQTKRPSREQSVKAQPGGSKSLEFDELTGFADYVVPPNALRPHRLIREGVADRHLNSFFDTIHHLLPLFEEDRFRSKYEPLRAMFGDGRLFLASSDDPNRPQFVCLLYAVLALGALYEDDQEHSASWASWYFAEAQEMMNRLLDAINLELVQAAMLLGAYAQHTIKPNLAYILNGLATRLGFSIGLNVQSVLESRPFDVCEAERTWWMIFVQEVELSLDSGRPMSLHPSEMNMEYLSTQVPENSDQSDPKFIFIRYLAAVADIIRRILELTSASSNTLQHRSFADIENLRYELDAWRSSVPEHLRFDDFVDDISFEGRALSLLSWQARQQSSLRIHYNLALIILMRHTLTKPLEDVRQENDKRLLASHQAACLHAARDMIRHIHSLFKHEPKLRRWCYYCFYCLQATLVLLVGIADTPSVLSNSTPHVAEHNNSLHVEACKLKEDLELCDLSIEVFDLIELKASRRCSEIIRHFLDKWHKHNASTVSSKASTLRSHTRGGDKRKAAASKQQSASHRSKRSANTSQGDAGGAQGAPANFVQPDLESPSLTNHSEELASNNREQLPYSDQIIPLSESSINSAVSMTTSHNLDDESPLSIGMLQTQLFGALHSGEDQTGLMQPNDFFPAFNFNFEFLDFPTPTFVPGSNETWLLRSKDADNASFEPQS